jgi:hypothetical protein
MSKIKRRPWSKAELHYLQNNPDNLSDQELAVSLNRSRQAIAMRRSMMDTVHKKMPRWSDADVETLKQLHSTHTDDQIGKILNRTAHAVWAKRKRLNLGEVKYSQMRANIAKKAELETVGKRSFKSYFSRIFE